MISSAGDCLGSSLQLTFEPLTFNEANGVSAGLAKPWPVAPYGRYTCVLQCSSPARLFSQPLYSPYCTEVRSTCNGRTCRGLLRTQG